MTFLLEQTVFDSGLQLACTLLVLLGAQIIYALFGFGSGLLSVAILAFLFPDLTSVVVLLLLVNLPTEVFVVWRDRRHIPFREMGLLLLALAVGTPLGAFLLRRGADEGWLLLLLGIVLILFAVFFLFLDGPRMARRLPSTASAAAGLSSGVLAGLFGTGGPPLILYYRYRGLDKQAFRAVLLAVFLATSVVRIPTYFASGIAGVSSVASALLVLPVCLLGLVVGNHLHVTVSERSFRRGTALVLALLGILLLVRH